MNPLKILLFFMSASDYCAGNRTKRILHGEQVLGRKGPYDAVRYTVAIGSVHGVPWYSFGFVFESLKHHGTYGDIVCTGALLTPSIIQTACHCVATFNADPAYRQPSVIQHWEGVKVVYIGINDRFCKPFSMQTRPPVKSKRFFVHRSCQRLPRSQGGNSYDFGYVSIDPSWIGGKIRVPTTNVDFTPIYTSEELSRIFDLYTRKPPVCLHMGYGNIDAEGTPTDFIRSGWSQMTNEFRCQYYTTANLTDRQIDRYMSWICTEPFPIHNQPIGGGDSGSPVTCNNVYFAVASATIIIKRLKNLEISIHDPIVFAENQNAMEYRRAFEEEVKNWDVDGDSGAGRIRGMIQNVMQVGRISEVKHQTVKSSSTSRWFAQGMSVTERSTSNRLSGLSDPALLLMATPFLANCDVIKI